MILVVWITACFFVLTCPPSRFQFKHDNCVYVCVFGSVIMILVVWITACFFVLTCPPLQVSILAWKFIPRKWKETCWKPIPKLKNKNYNCIFHPKWNYHFQKPNYHNQRTEVLGSTDILVSKGSRIPLFLLHVEISWAEGLAVKTVPPSLSLSRSPVVIPLLGNAFYVRLGLGHVAHANPWSWA